MKIEFLYTEVASLFGEHGTLAYLEKALPEATFIKTHLYETPTFASEDVNLIYMGPMSEKHQLIVLEKLRPYKGRLQELIAKGTYFLIVGNALDLFGKAIETVDGSIECLNIFDFTTKLNLKSRLNSLVMGDFNGMTLLGHKTQFTQSYGDISEIAFMKVIKGVGFNRESQYEGIQVNHFFGTNMVGPLLLLNPDFTQWFLDELTGTRVELPFKTALEDGYKQRFKEFSAVTKVES